VDREQHGLEHTLARVRALSPLATLERGYAVVQRGDGVVVRSAGDVAAGDALDIRVANGRLAAQVVRPEAAA
jgi:exodeoxyribonuclease VII large subunit